MGYSLTNGLEQQNECLRRQKGVLRKLIDKLSEKIEWYKKQNKLAKKAIDGLVARHAEVCEQLKQKTDRFNELCKRYEEMRVKLQRLTAPEEIVPEAEVWPEGVIAFDKDMPVDCNHEGPYWYWDKNIEDDFPSLVYKTAGSDSYFSRDFVYQPVTGKSKPHQPKKVKS